MSNYIKSAYLAKLGLSPDTDRKPVRRKRKTAPKKPTAKQRANAQAKRNAKNMRYLSRIPQSVPSGKIIAHNHARPTSPLGTEGFRAWIAEPSLEYEECPCKWAPELGVHYRVRRSS